MKKSAILIYFSLLLFSRNASAQITITSADIANPGRVIYMANDTTPLISVGAAGVNQTWNFLTTLHDQITDTLTYTPLVDAPNSVDFPSANLVIPVNRQGDIFYTVNDATALSMLASTENKVLYPGGLKETIVKTNTPAEKLLEFPSTYNTSFTQSIRRFTQYYFGSVPSISTSPGTAVRACGYSDSIRQKTYYDKIMLADAWGSITTLAGTHNAIRFKETKIVHDTMDAHDALLNAWFLYKIKTDSIVTYSWYANGMGAPLVTAVMDSAGAVKNVTWMIAPLGTTGVNEISSSSNLSVFPNPAQDVITFDMHGSKANYITIYDITGRVINTYSVSSDRETINVSAYSKGMYTYSLLDKKNNVLNRGKFSVIK